MFPAVLFLFAISHLRSAKNKRRQIVKAWFEDLQFEQFKCNLTDLVSAIHYTLQNQAMLNDMNCGLISWKDFQFKSKSNCLSHNRQTCS